MTRHIFIHFHDAGTAHDPGNGQFTGGGGGGGASTNKIDDANHGKTDLKTGRRAANSNRAEHPDEGARKADVEQRHQQMLAAGFKHTGTRAAGSGEYQTHHQDYAHADGRKGMISHGKGGYGKHIVSATTNYK